MCYNIKKNIGQVWWVMLVIPATEEVEIQRIAVLGQ
jgi:hypothetical protein